MVNIWFIVRSYIVPLLLTTLVNFIALGWVYKNRLEPLITEAQNALKTGMSAMGQKSGVVRNQQAFDKELAGGIVDQYPELEMALELLNPDLAEKVKDNPSMALNFLQRYGPMLGINLTGKGAQTQQEYDL